MIYEMRVYTAPPGKLPALLARFQNYTLPIWERMRIRTGGFWTGAVEANSDELVYFIVWDSLADREARWPVFQADPEWLAARAVTEKDGPIVSKVVSSFLEPTSFSTVK